MNRSVLPSYYSRAGNHQILAVLPVQTHFLGMDAYLEKMDTTQFLELREELTESVYLNILKRSGLRERDIKIAFQTPKVTLARLKSNGINVLHLMDEDPVELARVIGVDAVVLIRVRADGGIDRYLVSIGEIVVDDEVDTEGDDDRPLFRKYEQYRVYMQAQLIDGYDGSLLWHFDKRKSPQVEISLAEGVGDISRAMVRQFPYKNMEGVYGNRQPIFAAD